MFHRASTARDRSEPPTSPTSFSSKSLPPSPSASFSRRSARVLYQHPSGSRFLEDAVSGVLSSEAGSDVGTIASGAGASDVGTGVGMSVDSLEFVPATLPSRLRTQSSRLQKARRVQPPLSRPSSGPPVRTEESVPDSGSESGSSTWTMASIPTSIRSPAPTPLRPLSFCPTPHPAESFTEYDRLQVRSGEVPSLVLLRAVAPETSELCSELLHTSLPPNRDAIRDIIPRRNGFVDTILEAYNNHRGLIIRPDDVWLAIVTQFSFFVHGHTEPLRSTFVAHEGCKLVVEVGENLYAMDTPTMAKRMTAIMDDRIVDRSLCEWIKPDFTTTTPVDEMMCAVVMMGMTKDDSTHKFTLQCGIPKVTLEGEKRDWETVLNRLEHLKKYGIRTIAWSHLLRPILTRFVAAYDHPNHSDNLDFWNKIAHQESGNGSQYLSGWITAFCVFNARGQWQGNTLNEERIREHEPKKLLRRADPLQLTPSHFAAVYTVRTRAPYLALDGFPYPTIESGDVPCGYACLDVVLDHHGHAVETVLIAGAVGAQICSTEKTELFRNGMRDTVRLVSAWWCLVKREEKVVQVREERETSMGSERLSVLSL